MNVLWVEDRGSATFHLTRWLTDQGHVVLTAFNPADAQSFWDNRKEVPIHCIILDLFMPSDGLTPEQAARSEGGVLIGWVWLSDCVLPQAPEMRTRTIIYSDYVASLKASKHVRREAYDGIVLVPKRQPGSSSSRTVSARVREIARLSAQQGDAS